MTTRARNSRTLVAGTRASRLALWQTDRVLRLLAAKCSGQKIRVHTFLTGGDRDRISPLQSISRPDVFTREIEDALRSGEIDFAVHSLKDLPVTGGCNLRVAAVPERADVRDVLVARNGWTTSTLPYGATVGTCSLRRTAQLRAIRHDLNVVPIRGNVEARVQQVVDGELDATILAAAGLDRLRLSSAVTQRFGIEAMMPAPAQAALAVQCREDDDYVLDVVQRIDDAMLHRCVDAERAVLASIGDTMPGTSKAVTVAAYASSESRGRLHLRARLLSLDGSIVRFAASMGSDPVLLSRRACTELLRTEPTSFRHRPGRPVAA